MKMRAITTGIFAMALGLASSAFASGGDRDPTGESAHYTVDRASARTSGLVLGGELTASVTGLRGDLPGGPAYEGKIDYTFRIQFMGTRTGTEIVNLPVAYFTDQFMADLRANGSFEGPTFKVQHLGYADAANMDGGRYPNCDKIRIYDIQQEASLEIVRIAKALLIVNPAEADGIDDLVIVGHIFQGVPVLGAVKLDVSGKYSGMNVKAGADFDAP
jgi:hypothetical protein